jgi:hypothetical protein
MEFQPCWPQSHSSQMYVFPGLGLAASVAGVAKITDGMLYEAAVACVDAMNPEEIASGRTFPAIDRIREVSHQVRSPYMWQSHGDHVAITWRSRGFRWQSHGDHVAITWRSRGFRWQSHGDHVVSGGSHMAITWFQVAVTWRSRGVSGGSHMAITWCIRWQSHGDHMAIAW